MNNLLALTQRELKSLWYSPIAYVIGALFLLTQGWVFGLLLAALNNPFAEVSGSMAQFFFSGLFYWFSVLITIPFLTMRSFSEEKRTGSIELLMTAPVTDTHVVLSKFLGAWIAYIALWTATLPFFVLLSRLAPFDWAPMWTGYLGTCLLGSALVAIGVLASSVTRNQVIAAFLSFCLILALFVIGLLDFFFKDPETTKLIQYLSIAEHVHEFSKGLLDTRPMIFDLSLTAIALFLTGRIINSPRWRS